ncbi:beta-ketoacyl-ACP synthase III [Catenulispora rubra]|uniref:beta-ketoacyl-ACP synthase III n=1 Tax=Catenulispora rubra TaxID=280293 RepID=UPI001891F495|nr:beta-ketoacyl-ACP synthase III [Catenulispora rubra]
MPGSRIAALGHSQPDRVLTNADLAQLVDTSDEWITTRVGVRTRRVAEPGQTVDEFAAMAAGKALAGAGIAASDVDLVLVATSTASAASPNTAARVAARLGMTAPATIDVNVVCSGFTHALALADQAIRCGQATTAVVVGADFMSAVTDWTDRTTCVLVGDGAGAAVVTATDKEPGISPVLWGSVPERGRAVVIEGTPNRFSQEGQTVFRWATTELPAVARRVCDRAGIRPEDLAGVVFHQANLRIIEPLAAKLGAVNAVIARDVVDSGNTSAASIPIALAKLVERREIPAGAPVLLFGFGGNLSYAGQVVTSP